MIWFNTWQKAQERWIEYHVVSVFHVISVQIQLSDLVECQLPRFSNLLNEWWQSMRVFYMIACRHVLLGQILVQKAQAA